MDLSHSFTVDAPVSETWDFLTDVPRVARCMPGATIEEGSSDPYVGTVKVKVGAVVVQLRGSMRFSELDQAGRSLKMVCEGSDPRGGSGASAVISMRLVARGERSTEVQVTTSLSLSGKIAQFGQGMLQDVSDAILQKFVSNLQADMAAGSPAVDGSAGPSADRPAADDADVIDLGAAVLPALLRRYGTAALAGLGFVLSLLALLRTRRSGASALPVTIPTGGCPD